jgi:hypothetical protein
VVAVEALTRYALSAILFPRSVGLPIFAPRDEQLRLLVTLVVEPNA